MAWFAFQASYETSPLTKAAAGGGRVPLADKEVAVFCDPFLPGSSVINEAIRVRGSAVRHSLGRAARGRA